MSDKLFKLEIVTPQKVVFSGEVESFTAPGVMGSFQVLYNHAPLLAEIGIGEAKYRDAQGVETTYATSGGFVEVMHNRVVLLAETAESAKDIDMKRAEEAKARAQERLSNRTKELDVKRAEVALQRALNRLKVSQQAR